MKGKRADLRLARKVKSRKSFTSVTKTQKRASAVGRLARGSRRTALRDQRSKAPTKSQIPKLAESKRTERAAPPDLIVSVVSEDSGGELPEIRRRRTNTSEYIKKRFLYDSSELLRNTRHERRSAIRTRPVVSESHAVLRLRNLRQTKQHTTDGSSLPERGKRGRRKKDKPARSINSQGSASSVTEVHLDEEVSHRTYRKKARKVSQSRQRAVSQDNRSTWELPDVYEMDERITFADTLSGDREGHIRRRKSPITPLSELRVQSDRRTHDYFGEPRPVSHSKKRSDGNRRLPSTKRHKRINILDSHSFFSVGALSPGSDRHGDNLLNFCSDENSERYGRNRHRADLDTGDEDYLNSPLSHELSEEQSQPPNEDIEEEDLLAPELSILAGPTAVTGTDGVVLSDTHTLLTSMPQPSGGSRRKSPVRPMQVIRTKSSAQAPSTVPTSMFGNNPDNSSLLYTQTTTYGRRPSSDDSGRADESLPTVYRQQSLIETSQTLIEASSGLKSASILRLPSNLGTTSIKIRPLRDRAPDGKDPQNSPASQPLAARSFTKNSPHPGTTVSAKPVLPHTTHSSSNGRRRPSILKRGSNGIGGSPFPGQSQTEPASSWFLGSEMGIEVTHIPTARTIGAFTPGSAHSRRTTSLIQSSSATRGALTEAGPTKLLQLVTASSLIVPLTPAPLTASDKLFGRRQTGYGTHSPAPTGLSSTSLTQNTDTENTRIPTAPLTSPPYRYAVLRGGPGGKRYLVLGNPGVFDRSTIAPLVSSKSSKTADAEQVEEKSADGQDSCQTPSQSSDVEDNAEDRSLFEPQSDRSVESELTQVVEPHMQSAFEAVTNPVPNAIVPSMVAT